MSLGAEHVGTPSFVHAALVQSELDLENGLETILPLEGFTHCSPKRSIFPLCYFALLGSSRAISPVINGLNANQHFSDQPPILPS
jgi:hypothetical protein